MSGNNNIYLEEAPFGQLTVGLQLRQNPISLGWQLEVGL